jgi:putative transposase
MPWDERTEMDDRTIFIGACLLKTAAFSVLCARHGISRKTGYKWLDRYRAEGALGLEARPPVRHTLAHAIPPAIGERVLTLRRERPTWGPRKLLACLAMDDPATAWPAASTVGDLLRREGLSKPRRRRTHASGAKPALIEPLAPNESWAIDFKGWFRTGDGVRCEPLTLTDGYSRYLFACEAMPQPTAACVQPVLIRQFRENGLPRALRSDNGSPFASAQGLAGLTQLSVWLLGLNIWPDRIDKGRPCQNGRHERMHRVLREDAANPPSATLAEQQRRLDAWRVEYNTVRPHEALGQRCPATLYTPSPRPYPAAITAWDYPADHHVLRVNTKGYIRWRDHDLYLTEALSGQTVALAQRDDDDWTVRFRQFDLAMVGDETNTIRQVRLGRVGAPAAAAGTARVNDPNPAGRA